MREEVAQEASPSSLSVSQLTFTYFGKASRTEVLRGCSFSIEGPALCAITGTSGVGKTTLLYILAGLVEPVAGSVTYGAASLFDMTPAQRARLRSKSVASSFQPPTLLRRLSARANLEVSATTGGGFSVREARQRADALLELLQLTHRQHHTMRKLSQGEQQRVNLGNALARRADILLLDEPTKSLDADTAASVISVLKERSKGALVISATHDDRLTAASVESYVMDGGRLLRRSQV